MPLTVPGGLVERRARGGRRGIEDVCAGAQEKFDHFQVAAGCGDGEGCFAIGYLAAFVIGAKVSLEEEVFGDDEVAVFDCLVQRVCTLCRGADCGYSGEWVLYKKAQPVIPAKLSLWVQGADGCEEAVEGMEMAISAVMENCLVWPIVILDVVTVEVLEQEIVEVVVCLGQTVEIMLAEMASYLNDYRVWQPAEMHFFRFPQGMSWKLAKYLVSAHMTPSPAALGFPLFLASFSPAATGQTLWTSPIDSNTWLCRTVSGVLHYPV
jgi:hypothetical protein